MAEVKICGLSSPETVACSIEAGARYVGFVFYPPSPRCVSVQVARELALEVPVGVARVGLFVDPDDDELDSVLETVPLDMVQIHKVTDHDRLSALRERAGLPMILPYAIGGAGDVDAAMALRAQSDLLLLDAKPPKDANLPGGNGVSFDWDILAGRRMPRGWMLAGGLTPQTVGRAVNLTGAPIVDVSSGVESAPGIKDPALIMAFIAAAKGDLPPRL